MTLQACQTNKHTLSFQCLLVLSFKYAAIANWYCAASLSDLQACIKLTLLACPFPQACSWLLNYITGMMLLACQYNKHAVTYTVSFASHSSIQLIAWDETQFKSSEQRLLPTFQGRYAGLTSFPSLSSMHLIAWDETQVKIKWTKIASKISMQAWQACRKLKQKITRDLRSQGHCKGDSRHFDVGLLSLQSGNIFAIIVSFSQSRSCVMGLDAW